MGIFGNVSVKYYSDFRVLGVFWVYYKYSGKIGFWSEVLVLVFSNSDKLFNFFNIYL